MENRKCLHCGKDLTEADILHFNEFCCVECLNKHREKIILEGENNSTKSLGGKNITDFYKLKNEYIYSRMPISRKNYDEYDLKYKRNNEMMEPYRSDIRTVLSMKMAGQDWHECKSRTENEILFFDIVRNRTQIEINLRTGDKAAFSNISTTINFIIDDAEKLIPYRIGDGEIRFASIDFIGYIANNFEFYYSNNKLKIGDGRYYDKDNHIVEMVNNLFDKMGSGSASLENATDLYNEYLYSLQKHTIEVGCSEIFDSVPWSSSKEMHFRPLIILPEL